MTRSEEIAVRLAAVLKDIKPTATFSPDAHVRKDLGLDSLDVMSLMFDVEKAFDIKIPEEDISNRGLLTLHNLIDYVHERASQRT